MSENVGEQTIKSAYYEMGATLAEIVFHPDYYKGKWFVQLDNRKKVCNNHSTAEAWAKYLRRNGYMYITIGKVFDKNKG